MTAIRHTRRALSRAPWLLGAWLCGAGIASVANAADASGPPADLAPAAEIVIPKSVFTDDPLRGRDPFFPTSNRRSGPKPVLHPSTNAQPRATEPAAKPLVPSRHLVLRAISRIGGRQVAWISGSGIVEEFTEDVEKTLRTPDGPLKVRCLKIQEKSVTVSVEGESEGKELSLKGGS